MKINHDKVMKSESFRMYISGNLSSLDYFIDAIKTLNDRKAPIAFGVAVKTRDKSLIDKIKPKLHDADKRMHVSTTTIKEK